MENTIFVISTQKHIIFCAVACLFFLAQFIRLRNKYQLSMTAAIAASLLVYVSDNKTWFYCVGILEAVLLVLSAVLLFVDRKKINQQKEQTPPADSAPTGENA